MERYFRHSGILKMKWGVRRYQNKDGTWTEEGKLRRRAGYKAQNPDGTSNKTSKKKNSVSRISDEELQKRINRMKMEKEYKQLKSDLHPKKFQRVRKIAADIAEKAVVGYASKLIESKLNEVFKEPEKKTRIKGVDPTKLSDKALLAYNNRRKAEEEALGKKSNYTNIVNVDPHTMSNEALKAFNERVENESKARKAQNSREYLTNDEKRYEDWLKDRKGLHHGSI